MVARTAEHRIRGSERTGFRPNIKIHAGQYQFQDRAHIYKRLESQVQQEWLSVADKLGLDPNRFPAKAIHFWAKKPSEEEREILDHSDNGKRHFFYRRMPLFLRKEEAAGRVRSKRRPILDIKFDRTGVVPPRVIGHEVLHVYALQDKIPVYSRGPGKFFSEGFALMADLLITGRAESSSVPEGFAYLRFMERSKGKISRKDRKYAMYSTANGLLHLYLVWEHGGIASMAHPAFAGIRNGSELMRAYETVYGESYRTLIDKAHRWYDQKVKPLGGPQNLKRT